MADPISPFLILGIANAARSQINANQANKASEQAYQNALKASTEQKARSQRELTEWDATYGVLEENLVDSITNLTPDKIAALGLQESQTQYQLSLDQVKQDFAKRGLTGSGVEAHTLAKAAFGNAENRARIKLSAEDEVVNRQLQLLNIGLDEKGRLRNNLFNAENNEINIHTGQAGQKAQIAQNNLNQVDQSISSGVNALGYQEGVDKANEAYNERNKTINPLDYKPSSAFGGGR